MILGDIAQLHYGLALLVGGLVTLGVRICALSGGLLIGTNVVRDYGVRWFRSGRSWEGLPCSPYGWVPPF